MTFHDKILSMPFHDCVNPVVSHVSMGVIPRQIKTFLANCKINAGLQGSQSVWHFNSMTFNDRKKSNSGRVQSTFNRCSDNIVTGNRRNLTNRHNKFTSRLDLIRFPAYISNNPE